MKRTLIIVIALIFVAISGVGFLYPLISADGHFGCHAMPGEQAMCSMSPLEHLDAWQMMMSAIIPLLAMIAYVYAVHMRSLMLHLRRQHVLCRRAFSNEQAPVFNLYQDLFSEGILNSKAY